MNLPLALRIKVSHFQGYVFQKILKKISLVCQDFLKTEKFRFSRDVDEVVILKKTLDGGSKVETRCFRTAPGRQVFQKLDRWTGQTYFVFIFSYGWCGTIRDYSSFPEGDVQVETDSGWGFCERSCYPDTDVSLGGIARKKVDVKDSFFRQYLQQ